MATINHKTYNETTETFKDFYVYDGKETLIFKVDGEGGNVGIGTSSPTSYYSNKLVVYAAGENGITIANTATTGSNYLMFADGTTVDERYRGFIEYAHTGDYMALATSGAEKIRITSAGNVGIGTTTSTYDAVKIGSSHRFLNVQAGSGSYAVGTLAGNQSGNGDRLGYLTFVNDNNSASYKYSAWIGSEVEGTTANQQGGRLIFSTTSDASSAGPIERLRIDSSGNVGIGTDSPAFKLDVNGVARIRTGTDGIDVGNPSGNSYRANLLLRGTTAVGANSVSYIGVNVFNTAGSLDVTSDADIIIRNDATERARFLAAGGLTFNGDTAAANALDDYEEGTWTVGLTFGGGSTGITYDFNSGTYTKVGRKVTVNGYLLLSSAGSSTGAAAITGLPFAIGGGSQNSCAASMWMRNVSFLNQFQGIGTTTGTTISLWEVTNVGGLSALDNTNFTAVSDIIFSMTYFV